MITFRRRSRKVLVAIGAIFLGLSLAVFLVRLAVDSPTTLAGVLGFVGLYFALRWWFKGHEEKIEKIWWTSVTLSVLVLGLLVFYLLELVRTSFAFFNIILILFGIFGLKLAETLWTDLRQQIEALRRARAAERETED